MQETNRLKGLLIFVASYFVTEQGKCMSNMTLRGCMQLKSDVGDCFSTHGLLQLCETWPKHSEHIQDDLNGSIFL